jgi:hypothetical protein
MQYLPASRSAFVDAGAASFHAERSDAVNKSKSYKENLVDWGTLAANLAAHLAELPQLAADQRALADLVAQARALQEERERARAYLQDLNQRRMAVVGQALRVQSRIAEGVRNAYDLDSEKLVEFGVKPRRKKVRRSPQERLERARQAAARLAGEIAALEAAKPPAAEA